MPKTPLADLAYKYVTALLCCGALLFIFFIVVILIPYSYPSFVYNGLKFFTTIIWNPALNGNLITVHGVKALSGSSYGLLVFLYGTLVSSGMAVLFGVPAGLAVAIFLTQIAPKQIVAPISFLVELLAGIPSVIFGFWGILVLGPFLLHSLEPQMIKYFGFIPFLQGPPYSYGFLGSGLILAIMIVPIIASISRDVMTQTPVEQKEGAKALGLTNWEITRKIVLPYARTGIIGAVILGLGRALGETMAVAFVSGSAINIIPPNFYSPINTLSAFMTLSLDSAFTDPSGMYVSALVECAVTLLAITMLVNVIARAMVKQGFIRSAEGVIRV